MAKGSKVREYVLTYRVVRLLRHDPICFKCKEEIFEGEKVVSRRGGAGLRIIYHRSCAEELNIV